MTVDRLIDFAAHTNPGFILIFAGVLAALARGTPARALALVGGPLLALVALIFSAEAGTNLATFNMMGFELVLYRPDSLSMVFGLAFIIASGIAGVYSLHRQAPVLDSTALIYAGAAVGAVFAGDLLTLFLFWELTAIASVFQVLVRGTRATEASSLRYLVFQLGSGLLLLGGVAMHYAATGRIAFADMAAPGAAPPVGVIDISSPGAVMILVAFGIKAAFPLLHSWLQDFYPRATETGTVVLSAFTTKLAVYALARCFAGVDALIWIGAVMAVFPAFLAVLENDLRRVLVWSLMIQVGLMVAAVGMGTELALNGAAAMAFAGVIYQALLFMCIGAVLWRTGTTKATELGGLHRTMPYTTLFCLIGAASIAALPFLAGFSAKSMVLSTAHGDMATYGAWVALLFGSVAVFVIAGVKTPLAAFFTRDSGQRPKEAPFNMLLAMGLAAGLCIAIGVSPAWLYDLLPYRDTATGYLVSDLFTAAHLLEQAQLLAFGVLAFVLLKRLKLEPMQQAGVVLDVEWLWRRGLPLSLGWARETFGGAWKRARKARERLGEATGFVMREVFAPDGLAGRRAGLSRMGVLALVALAGALALAMGFFGLS